MPNEMPPKMRAAHERARWASHALAESVGWDAQTRRAAQGKRVEVSRESFQKLGLALWPHTLAKYGEEDIDHIVQGMMRAATSERDFYLFNTEIGQTGGFHAARWAHYGFPTVQFSGHRYAAALMATKIPEGEVLPPWKSFLIELPNGLMQTKDGSGEYQDLAYCMVSYHAFKPSLDADGPSVMGWSIDAHTRNGINLHVHRQTLDNLRANKIGRLFEDPSFDAFAYQMDSEDDRTMELLVRLVINACLAMSNPEVVRPIGKNHPKDGEPVGTPRTQKEPACRVYRVGRDITLDCRDALRDYVRGERRGPLTVQFLVRGHWRQQACGPKFSDRRATWIEPYWKGPEDAPIPVRGIKVG